MYLSKRKTAILDPPSLIVTSESWYNPPHPQQNIVLRVIIIYKRHYNKYSHVEILISWRKKKIFPAENSENKIYVMGATSKINVIVKAVA